MGCRHLHGSSCGSPGNCCSAHRWSECIDWLGVQLVSILTWPWHTVELCLLPILFRYCGTACSHADWPKHRNVCKALGQQRLAAKAAAAAAREAA